MLEQVFENYATKLTICEGQPATYADATTAPATGNMLGEVVIDATDFSLANGDTSGRKTIMVAQSGIAIAFSGGGNKLADHIALVNTAGTALIGVWRNAEERENTAQAGAASTITLDASASASDDAYNSLRIDIIGGTGNGQSRIITDYDGTTKIATVDSSWGTNPDATSLFVIYGKVVVDSDTADVQAFDPFEVLDAVPA